jgi:ABC-type dipeptide/oligopeptide/nickel transport system permease component/outer membrane protein assembly factor BamB
LAVALVAVPSPGGAGPLGDRSTVAYSPVEATGSNASSGPVHAVYYDSIGGWNTEGGSENRSGYTPVGGPLGSSVENVYCPSLNIPIRAGPVAAGSLVFVADVFGQVYAINRTDLDRGGGNNTVVWTASVGADPTTPDASSGALVIGDSTGTLSAIDIETGGPLWTAAMNGSIVQGVAVVNGTVFAGTSNGEVAAFSLRTGQTNWTVSLGSPISGAVAVQGGLVYVSTEGGELEALLATNGARQWSVSAGGTLSSGPAVLGNRVALVGNDTEVRVWNAGTGALDWEWNGSAAARGDRDESPPALTPTTLFIQTHEANLYAFNLSNGTLRWNQSNAFFSEGLPTYSAPAASSTVVYVYDATQQLKALSLATGRVVWRATFYSTSYGPVAVDSGEAMIADEGGCLHVVGSGASAFPWPVAGVVESENGTPIAGAFIDTGFGQSFTNASGGFALGLPNGTFDVLFGHLGFTEVSHEFVVTGPIANVTIVLPVLLVYPLSGAVVDSFSGMGIPGIPVQITGPDEFFLVVPSGPAGAFRADVPAGPLTLSVSSSARHDSGTIHVEMPAGPLTGVALAVPPTDLAIPPTDPDRLAVLVPLAALAVAGLAVTVAAARRRRIAAGLPPAVLSKFARYTAQRSILLGAQLVALLTILYLFGTYLPAAAIHAPVCSFSAMSSCGYCSWSNSACVAQAFSSGYGLFLLNLFTGNWGVTSYGHLIEPAWTFFVWYVPYSIELAVVALTISAVAAYVLGLSAGWNRDGAADVSVRSTSILGLLFPSFLVALLILTVIYSPFDHVFGDTPYGILPAPGWFEAKGTIPPWIGIAYNTSPTGFPLVDAFLNGAWTVLAVTLAKTIVQAALIAAVYVPLFLRYSRNAVAQAAEEAHVVAARARGIPESTIRWKHTGRRVIPIFLLAFAATLPLYIGTQSLIEAMLNDPGIGSLLLLQMTGFISSGFGFHPAAGAAKPGNFYQVTIFCLVTVVLVGSLASEVLSRYLDPRSGRQETS